MLLNPKYSNLWSYMCLTQVFMFSLLIWDRASRIYLWKTIDPDILEILNAFDVETGWGLYLYVCLFLTSLIDYVYAPNRASWIIKSSAIFSILIQAIGNPRVRVVLVLLLIGYHLPIFRTTYQIKNYKLALLYILLITVILTASSIFVPIIKYY